MPLLRRFFYVLTSLPTKPPIRSLLKYFLGRPAGRFIYFAYLPFYYCTVIRTFPATCTLHAAFFLRFTYGLWAPTPWRFIKIFKRTDYSALNQFKQTSYNYKILFSFFSRFYFFSFFSLFNFFFFSFLLSSFNIFHCVDIFRYFVSFEPDTIFFKFF